MIMKPSGWIVIRISPPKGPAIFKVFSSFVLEESWRLSSGTYDMSELSDKGGHFEWPQASGTVYHLYKDGENDLSSYAESVFNKIIHDCEIEGVTVEVIPLCPRDNS
ncbi:hypothetical protein [Shewanella spartinae]|uniref:hypothetical protein n=1 Tax=Shewanella spartinae TaxID=2864205 RepID=UPI001C65A437|nr:hypothetical protein [Shewanella spartinae]QYJ95701.1 hypothetical protein K0I31_10240 [Shewanella spartinae]